MSNSKTPITLSVLHSGHITMNVQQAAIVSLENLPIYAGPYDVTPTRSAQTLQTAEKRMTDNVEIKSIPYYETANTTGGTTFYIAKED